MEEEKQKFLILMKEHQQKENEAERRRKDLERQEDQAVSEIGETNIFKEIVNALTSTLFGEKVFSGEGAEKKAEALRQARREALETEQAIREKRHEALSRMTSFAAKIKRCQEQQNMAEYAVEALHEASGALKHLSDVMMLAALFWEQMEDHCKSLAETKITSLVTSAMSYSEKERLKVWTSNHFKRQAVEFYASWVALRGVCTVYMDQIKLTQSDLHQYIRESPTYEESRSNLKELVVNFLGDLQRDKKALSDKSFKAQEEIKSLEKKSEDDP